MNWQIVPLSNLASPVVGSFVDGPFGSNLKAAEYLAHGVPIIRLQNIRPNEFLAKDIKFIAPQKANELSRHNYGPGDLVISKLGDPPGYACVVPASAGSGVIVADVVRFRGDPARVDHRYLSYYLNSPDGRRQFLRLSKGTTRTRVNLTSIKTIEIPLPPTAEEQKRIALVLDKADALRRLRQQTLGLSEHLLRSVFVDMFGDLDANPKGWDRVPLEHLCERIVDCPHSTPVYSDSPTGFYCIRSSDIQNGKLDLESARFVSEVVFTERIARHRPKAGEVIYTREGGRLGYAAQVPNGKQVCLGQRMMLFSGHKNVASNGFLRGLLNLESFRNRVLNFVGGGAAPRVNIKDLKVITVYKPPIELQLRYEQFARVLAEEEESLSDSETHIARLFSSLQQRAFRGELDLSRIVLYSPADSLPVDEPEKPASEGTTPSPTGVFLHAPAAAAGALKELDDAVSQGEPIPWSADYFKYRILGTQSAPFSFGEVMQKAASIFVEPPYEEMKDMIFELLGSRGGGALLMQSFDLHIDANTKEASGRKEIVFGPVA